ncbi:VOC family protein [Roseomonas elaeocarpi]|uniref:VOC family protein n=1 Tax=Roseomonas elaeocarpi TaxID=907779 RepID=A0ABV6JQU0_9PROT
MAVTALDRVVLVTPSLDAAVAFYRDALGFHPEAPPGPAPAELLLGLEGTRARSCCLRIGAQAVELVQYEPAGARYPGAVGGNDGRFQHFAMAVRDMEAAMARLRRVAGWEAITRGDPQQLPPENGGVVAFKFRDPDGHPLEFLQFPRGSTGWDDVGGDGSVPGPVLGIDHTAISVSDVARSTRFLVDGLGLHLGSRSLNQGAAQERLDGLPSPRLDVLGLNPAEQDTPHLELLGYHSPAPRAASAPGLADVVATRTVLRSSNPGALSGELRGRDDRIEIVATDAAGNVALIRDPDGHLLLLLQPAFPSS